MKAQTLDQMLRSSLLSPVAKLFVKQQNADAKYWCKSKTFNAYSVDIPEHLRIFSFINWSNDLVMTPAQREYLNSKNYLSLSVWASVVNMRTFATAIVCKDADSNWVTLYEDGTCTWNPDFREPNFGGSWFFNTRIKNRTYLPKLASSNNASFKLNRQL